jgi:hypothetical protein
MAIKTGIFETMLRWRNGLGNLPNPDAQNMTIGKEYAGIRFFPGFRHIDLFYGLS